MPKLNHGPRLVYQVGKGYTNPYWFVVWYDGGTRRERCAKTQDRGEAQAFMNRVLPEVSTTQAMTGRPPRAVYKAPHPREQEAWIQQMYSGPGVKFEVQIDAGKIDVLTASEIIEIKEAKCWKQALGQVLVYGLGYPLHKKTIHLFGALHPRARAVCDRACAHYGVSVIWEMPLATPLATAGFQCNRA